MFLRQCRIESKVDPSFLAQNRFTGNRTEGSNRSLSGHLPSNLQNHRVGLERRGTSAKAADLHVSYKTIVNTCGQLKTKLGAYSLPKLMRIAIEHLPSSGKD